MTEFIDSWFKLDVYVFLSLETFKFCIAWLAAVFCLTASICSLKLSIVFVYVLLTVPVISSVGYLAEDTLVELPTKL